jgi:hypothetical protein
MKIQKATNEIIGAIDSLKPKTIASSDTLVSTPKPEENDDDDVFQLDIAEILAARRELANCSIDSQRDKVLALASN